MTSCQARFPLFIISDSCSFTATSQHLDYMIRMSYARIEPSYKMREGILIDPYKWQDEFCIKYPKHKRQWSIWALLEKAKNEGVPLWNGKKLKINACYHVPKGVSETYLPAISVKEALRKAGSLIDVFRVANDYMFDGQLWGHYQV